MMMDGWMDGWKGGWMDGCMGEWMDGWMDGGIFMELVMPAMLLMRKMILES